MNGNFSGCVSMMGKRGGKQIVKLSNRKCFILKGIAFHELMHNLGFDHEHSRHDRDEFIEIMTSNIAAINMDNFSKLPGTSFGVPYDYYSVMHYSLCAFAKNRSHPSMKPKVTSEDEKILLL